MSMDTRPHTFPEIMHLLGYDQEGAYVFRYNMELIERLRQERLTARKELTRGPLPPAPPAETRPKTRAFTSLLARLFAPRPTGIGQFPV